MLASGAFESIRAVMGPLTQKHPNNQISPCVYCLRSIVSTSVQTALYSLSAVGMAKCDYGTIDTKRIIATFTILQGRSGQ